MKREAAARVTGVNWELESWATTDEKTRSRTKASWASRRLLACSSPEMRSTATTAMMEETPKRIRPKAEETDNASSTSCELTTSRAVEPKRIFAESSSSCRHQVDSWPPEEESPGSEGEELAVDERKEGQRRLRCLMSSSPVKEEKLDSRWTTASTTMKIVERIRPLAEASRSSDLLLFSSSPKELPGRSEKEKGGDSTTLSREMLHLFSSHEAHFQHRVMDQRVARASVDGTIVVGQVLWMGHPSLGQQYEVDA
ncbi:unnamed protein product [Linum trigynum]|uniref:Uncharacterized protein n=1 Tax=Linum trigynum TaxID=586398 RepID=A0AAV2GIN3_9ROSI